MKPLNDQSMPEIERVPVVEADLPLMKSEDDFTGLAVRLLIEIGSYACLAASITGESGHWDRDRAAIGGNIVRLYKLIDSMLDQTTQRRGELMFIILRLTFETLVNIVYLIRNFGSGLVDSYVAHSLRHERKLRDTIEANIEKRDAILPIEDRMLKSIDRAAAAAGIELSDVDPKLRTQWGGKNLYEKTKAIGWDGAYLGHFGGPSHGVHGSWHELYANHLEWDQGEGFRPKLDWAHPRPQPLFAVGVLIIDTLAEYADFLLGADLAREVFTERLSDLRRRVVTVDEAHEHYLSGKKWPER